MTTIHDKAELRRLLRARRARLGVAVRREAAAAALRRLLHSSYYQDARHVAGYFSIGNELPTEDLLRSVLRSGRRLYVPRLEGDDRMHFVAVETGTPLRNNRYGIPEPLDGLTRPASRLDLIILPLVGFDGEGRRLGAGGGFYDRTLAFARASRRPALVGWAYACQELDRLPEDPHDIRLDAIVTDRHLRRFG